MKVKVNSPLGWLIHILFAALMGWFVGYLLIPALAFNLLHHLLSIAVRLVITGAVGALFLYAFRTGMDTAFPFKNGGWLR
jgi:hypothetical protein